MHVASLEHTMHGLRMRWVHIQICNLLPFAHVIAGCDTTSRLFGIGKGVALRELSSDAKSTRQLKCFPTTPLCMDDIEVGPLLPIRRSLW